MDFLREPSLLPFGSPDIIGAQPVALETEHPPTDLGVGPGLSPPDESGREQTRPFLLRKEVIQPHLPVQLPCYDFVPVTKPDLGACLPCGLAQRLQSFSASMT